jgi:exonuclease VII small subunit
MGMDRREQLHELHLALEGAVDQLTRAQRLAIAGETRIEELEKRVETLFVEVVSLRNQVREELMKALATPPSPPTIRKGK